MMRILIHLVLGACITMVVVAWSSYVYRDIDGVRDRLAERRGWPANQPVSAVMYRDAQSVWFTRPLLRNRGVQVLLGSEAAAASLPSGTDRRDRPWWLPESAIRSRLGPRRHIAADERGWIRGWDVALGWPLPAFRYEAYGVEPTSYAGAFVHRFRMKPGDMPKRVAFPLIILWPGFIVNSIAYGALTYSLCRLLIPVRSRSRRRRGLCERCRYPVSGLATCPECGVNVMRSLVSEASRKIL